MRRSIFICLHTSSPTTSHLNVIPDMKIRSPILVQDSLDRLVPEGQQYRHLDEGMDDMPAHVRRPTHRAHETHTKQLIPTTSLPWVTLCSAGV